MDVFRPLYRTITKSNERLFKDYLDLNTLNLLANAVSQDSISTRHSG